MAYVHNFFKLNTDTINEILELKPNFGYNGFGEIVFYRTYSRICCKRCRLLPIFDGREACPECGYDFIKDQETWNNVVIRVINGTFSIRKDWYIKNNIDWDEDFWQHYARHMSLSMFRMEWMPPGRGLWAMGTQFIYERGSMALQNCGYCLITDEIGEDVAWTMDALMCGVGVGFNPLPNDDLKIYDNSRFGTYNHIIADTREGWCESVKALIDYYIKPEYQKPEFDYNHIRPKGLPIRGFGGISSGPEALIDLHDQIRRFFTMFASHNWYTAVMLKADIVNCVGCCVVSGNVRRSAELLAGKFKDIADLKNYEKYPYRESHGFMSNNSIILEDDEDFDYLIDIAELIKVNGEPGYINKQNMKYGRIGKKMKGLREDKAVGFNPCGEQPLEDKELCTLVVTCPTKCPTAEQWLRALEYATTYASTVTLLPTHSAKTNSVMLRNRRIGVDITDIVTWKHNIGVTDLIKYLRKGYKKVRATNKWLNNEAGIPEAIRVTTIKPGGTVPKLPGVVSGWQNPTFDYTLRRIRIAQDKPIFKVLHDAGIPHEPDVFSKNTEVFEYPIDQGNNGQIKPATKVSLWEQAMMLVLLQREWSDNAVSNTLYFKPKWLLIKDIEIGETFYEEHIDPSVMEVIDKALNEFSTHYIDYYLIVQHRELDEDTYKYKLEQDQYTNKWKLKIWAFDPNHEEDVIEHVLAMIAPLTKSCAVLPHAPVGVYRQMPEEGITKEEYLERLLKIKSINWSIFLDSDGIDERYCEGPSCKTEVSING